MKNNFENSVKNKVEQFDEIPSEKIWEDISQKINNPKVEEKTKNNSWKIWAALAVSAILLGTIFWKTNSPKKESTAEEAQQPIAEQTIESGVPSIKIVSAGDGETALEMFPIELSKARENGKALMVYVCMEGCVPCARFVDETLSQPEVIDFLDNNFDQVAVDMLAKENKPFLVNYGTKASPSVLFFNEDGEFLEKTTGAIPKEYFMEVAESAIEKILDRRSELNVPSSGQLDLKIYPNPSNGQFNIQLTTNEHPATIRILDKVGQTFYRKKIEKNIEGFEESIDLSGQPRGTYFIRIAQNGNVQTEKIIIQ